MNRWLGGLFQRRRPSQFFSPSAAFIQSEPLERRLLLSGGPQIVVGPVADVSRTADYEASGSIAIDPTNPSRLFVVSNRGGGLLAAVSDDAGATWTSRRLADGSDGLPVGFSDPQAAFDRFGNLHIAYLKTQTPRGVVVASSFDDGRTFSTSQVLTASGADQPSIAVGGDADSLDAQTVWVSFAAGGAMLAAGARIDGPGPAGVGQLSSLKTVARTSGNFGDIAVGAGGQVVVTWQSPVVGQGPSDLFIARDDDGLGAGKFSGPTRVASTNVGGFDRIPAQSIRSIDAAASLAYDLSGGSHRGRLFLSYVDENGSETDDTDVMLRHSDDDGHTWSEPVRVNDDATRRSQFLPGLAVDPTGGAVGLAWYDCRSDVGVRGPGYRDALPNTEPVVWATVSVDGGESFTPNFQVGAAPSNAAASGNVNQFGDALGLDFFNGVLRPLWADNSAGLSGNPEPTQFEIAASEIDMTSPAGSRVIGSAVCVTAPIDFVDVRFDRPMDLSGFSLQDDVAAFEGPGGVDLRPRLTSYEWIDDHTLRLHVEPLTAPGTYRLTIGPHIQAADGAAMDQDFDGRSGETVDDRFTLSIILAAPRVVSGAPSGIQRLPVAAIDVRFDQPMAEASVSRDAVASFVGPRGVDLLGALSSVTLLDDGRTLHVEFIEQTREGTYRLTLAPRVRSSAGLALNQDGDSIPGEATDDRFTATFQIDPRPGPDAFGYEAWPVRLEPIDLTPGAPGVVGVLRDAEDEYVPIPLGENTFNFYGREWTGAGALFVSANGLLSFGQGVRDDVNTDLASSSIEVIAALWDDWSASRSDDDQVLYRFDDQDGDGRDETLVVQWNRVANGGGSRDDSATFQAVLSLNTGPAPGDVLFNYPDLEVGTSLFDDGRAATVGLREVGADGARLLISCDQSNPLIKSGTSLLISQRPRVVSAVVRGSGWSPAFLSRLNADGLGDGGFELRTSSAARLPWSNLNQIAVRFDRPVQISAAALEIVSRRVAAVAAQVAGFVYDPTTLTATWTLVAPLRADHLTIFLPNVSGPASTDALWNLDVLPGDADRGGTVSAADLVQVRNRIGRRADSSGFSPFADLNGSGIIDAADVVLARNQIGSALPVPSRFILRKRSREDDRLEEDRLGS